MITCKDVIEKRKTRWNERHDIEFDKQLVEASVAKILSEPTLRQEVYDKPYLLIEIAFTIVDKDRRTVPFFLNDVQKDFIEKLETLGTDKPFFVLKGRQQGFTSLITAIQLSFAIVRRNFSGFTMSHRADSTRSIFNDKAKAVYDRLPDLLKPTEKYNNSYELSFSKLESSWRVATASDSAGRGMTISFIHFSEVAFYECSLSTLQSGIGEAITAGAIQVYETTANGYNQAKDLWDSGSCHNLFYEWSRSPEYRCTDFSYLDQCTDAWISARKKLLADMGCDREQIAWYCKKYAEYIDKSLIRQEYPISPLEAFISSGSSVFDMERINEQMIVASRLQAVRIGRFEYDRVNGPVKNPAGEVIGFQPRIENIRFVDAPNGPVTIHAEPEKKTQRISGKDVVTALAPYAIGGDTAGTGTDYFTAKVIHNMTGRTVATFRQQRMDDDLYAEQMFCLGKYYNDAMIGIEINYSRQPTRYLVTLGYPNMYMRETIDHVSDKRMMDYGFQTTTRTKPVIIAELVKLFREDPSIEPDMQTLKEMATFVRKENGSTEAIEGEHDDLVMALAIGHFVSGQQTHTWIPVKQPEDRWIENNFHSANRNRSYVNWEDY